MVAGGSPWRVAWLRVAVVGLACAAAPPPAVAAGPSPDTIAVYGDSVVEGYGIPGSLEHGLVPQLLTDVAREGIFERGAAGFIPANEFRWRFTHYALAGRDVPARDGWILAGESSPAQDGLSGYSGMPLSSASTATAPIGGDEVGVLFTMLPDGGVLTVTAGTQTFAIDTRSSGPPAPGVRWIRVPAGAHAITVGGTDSGRLIFDGVIDRALLSAGHIGVEVENLGHHGHRLAQDSAPRILAALAAQRFDISVFLDGYIWAYLAARGGAARVQEAYATELRTRIRLVRRYGGRCLVADPSPLRVRTAALIGAIDRRVARAEGCAYTGALTRLWNPLTAHKAGMTAVDGVHPTARGYRLMAATLAPLLVRMVRPDFSPRP